MVLTHYEDELNSSANRLAILPLLML